MIGSLVLYGIEDKSLNEMLIEKVIMRSMLLKAEEQLKKTKQPKKDQPENELSQVKYNAFLTFFKTLNEKDSDAFGGVIGKQCEVKAMKKNNVVVQESALIRIAEKPYADLKKQV